MSPHNERLTRVANNTVLYAIWPDESAPDGVATALISMPYPDREDAIVAAVRVQDKDDAIALWETLDPEFRT